MIKELKDWNEISNIVEEQFHTQLNLEDPFAKVLIYQENDKILGFLHYSNLLDHADLNYLWTAEENRRSGIASKLLNKVIETLKKENIHRITLEVREHNFPALSFYLKHGFQKKAIRDNYYGDEDGILMVLELGDIK